MSASFQMSVRDGVILHAFFMEEGLGSPSKSGRRDGLPKTMLDNDSGQASREGKVYYT